MRPGATKIESKGSFWWFDDEAKEYLRLPKSEGPREDPRYSNHEAGILQDAVWHPYVKYEILDWGDETCSTGPGLYITIPGREKRAFAPQAQVVG